MVVEGDSSKALYNSAWSLLPNYGTPTESTALNGVNAGTHVMLSVAQGITVTETEDVTAGMVRDERPLIAEMWRKTVAVNAKRPELVHMFSTLSAEALNPDHPAHDYFAEREEHIVEVAANIRWHVPEGVDAEQVLRSGFAMMDGAQLRWLRVPGRDLNEMWASCEDVLFPLPQWEGYR